VRPLRRLDHIGIVVQSTDDALSYFSGTLGLDVASSETLEAPPVRLTYLDVGNAFIQLIEPLDESSEIGLWLGENGEGVHHICFGVDDVGAVVEALDGSPPALGSGRGRPSAFLTRTRHGVRFECTEFDFATDVERTPGWLDRTTS
jgi:methylmalonyl-CoA/ethylmalonyl-CoA epimerase